MKVLLCLILLFQEHDVINDSWTGQSLTPEQFADVSERRVAPTFFDIRATVPTRQDPPKRVPVPLDVFLEPLGRNTASWPHCWGGVISNRSKTGPYHVTFRLELGSRKVRAPWEFTEMEYWVRPGSLFPMPDGEIYRAAIGTDIVRLTNITDDWPKEQRPRKTSLTIPGNCGESCYFQDKLHSEKFGVAGEIKIFMRIDNVVFAPQTPHSAELLVSRDNRNGRQVLTSELKEYDSLFKMRQAEKLTLTRDEIVTTGYRSYRVLNIIPPHELPDGGYCEGWIELEQIQPPK